MVLVLHIVIALSTVGVSGFTLIKPNSNKLRLSYLLTVLTFITGGYLVIMSPSHLVSACVTGLVFLGIVGTLLFAARHRLASIQSV